MVSVLITVLMFLVMISLHEFGHFIFGKLLGFRVIEYAIGFGPVIFKKQGKQTLYTVRLIPFGGFCQFDGEDEEGEDEGSFNAKPCYKRLIVLFAGAAFNIILGFLIFFGITLSSDGIYTNTIDTVIEYTALYDSGVEPGDEIIAINGKKVDSYRDIQLYTMDFREGEAFELTFRRNDEKKIVSITPTKKDTTVEYREDGIMITDTIAENTSSVLIDYSEQNPYKAELVGKKQNTSRLLIGFTPVFEKICVTNVIPETYNLTGFVVKLVYKSLYQIITGKVGMDAVSGPVGVVSEVSTAVESGSGSWLYVLNLVALLTINLGVMNLLPLPALDGGRILFVLIEWIRRKPIPRDKEGLIHGIGFALLFALMIFVFFQDIIKLFS